MVIYAYMGVYPMTDHGAQALLGRATELAVGTGSERLIVKTVAESRRIPTVEENVDALEFAGDTAAGSGPVIGDADATDSQTYREARALIEATLDLDRDISRALLLAFRRGSSTSRTASTRTTAAAAAATSTGTAGCAGPTPARSLGGLAEGGHSRRVTSAGLLTDLSYMRRRFDEAPPGPAPLPGPRDGAAGAPRTPLQGATRATVQPPAKDGAQSR